MNTIRYCVSAEALLALVPATSKKTSFAPTHVPTIKESRLSTALTWIDANEFGTWVKVGMALKTLESLLGMEALGLWLDFSERADESAKAHNDDDQYNPMVMWGSFTPAMPQDAATGLILNLAKQAAGAILRDELDEASLTDHGQDAVSYLEQHHQRYLNKILADAGIRGKL